MGGARLACRAAILYMEATTRRTLVAGGGSSANESKMEEMNHRCLVVSLLFYLHKSLQAVMEILFVQIEALI